MYWYHCIYRLLYKAAAGRSRGAKHRATVVVATVAAVTAAAATVVDIAATIDATAVAVIRLPSKEGWKERSVGEDRRGVDVCGGHPL